MLEAQLKLVLNANSTFCQYLASVASGKVIKIQVLWSISAHKEYGIGAIESKLW